MMYKKYKTVPFDWLQTIPSEWATQRLKKLLLTHYGGCWGEDEMGDENDLLCIRIADFNFQSQTVKPSASTIRHYSDQQILSGHLQDGDLILEKSGGGAKTPVGRVVRFKTTDNSYSMFANFSECLRPNKALISSDYLAYYLKFFYSVANMGRYYKQTTGIQNVDMPAYLNIGVSIPSRNEQDQIVRYLDWQVSKINRVIAAAKKEIALIKEIEANQITLVVWGKNSSSKAKTSGILGIGEVPEHWLIRANKRIFKERNEKSESGTETLLSVSRYYGVKPSNELSEDEQYATIKPAESLVGYKIVKKNDLAMNIMRAQNGSYGISDYEGIVSPAYCVYELLPGYSPKYMHYLLKTPQMISIFFAASSGITDHRRRLYADDFLRIKIAVPPLEEQEQIVEQIEKIEATFQGKTAAIEKQIELLKELRTRLISDVVTGQIDVRDIEIPEYEFVEDVSEDSEDSESEEEIVEQEDM